MQIVELTEIAAATEQAMADDVEKWVQEFCEGTGLRMEGVNVAYAPGKGRGAGRPRMGLRSGERRPRRDETCCAVNETTRAADQQKRNLTPRDAHRDRKAGITRR